MDFLLVALKVLVSLAIVVVLLLLTLPYLANYILRLRGIPAGSEGSFRVVKVQPLTRDIYVAELSIKGKTYILLLSGKGVEVIYRDEDDSPPSDTDSS
jgi:flagellar protein FliO/FliZ